MVELSEEKKMVRVRVRYMQITKCGALILSPVLFIVLCVLFVLASPFIYLEYFFRRE